MPDQQVPHFNTPERRSSSRQADLRSSAPRLKASRSPRSRLRIWLTGSLAAHLFALFVIIFVHVVAPPPQPPEQPSFGMVFEKSDTGTKGAPNPSQYTSTPQGEPSPDLHPTPQARTPPPSPPPTPAPTPPQPQAEVNLIPPEYQQQAQPPPPPQEQAESVPQQQRQKQARQQVRPRQSPPSRNNPFANPMLYSFAPQARQNPSGGFRSSHSLDLSAGPVVSGGRLQDAVAHVIGPGGRGDYMEALSEFVELHKYYPPSSARNGEEGESVLRVTIERDGTVKNMRLLSSSGSSMLDSAWEAVFRDNKLPPFPDDLPGNQQTFTLSLNYHLLYR